MFVSDFIVGNQAHGEVANALQQVRYDAGLMRPYFDSRGRPSVSMFTGKSETRKGPDGSPICNAHGDPVQHPVYRQELIANLRARGVDNPVWNATSLRRLEWEMIDRAVIRASRDRLRAWADISAANTYGGFNGMSKSYLVRETMTDVGEALVDMDGLTESRGDSPLFTPDALPLPITHSGFHLSSRTLAESRNTGTPLDTTLAENCGRRVAETIEKMTIGTMDLSAFVGGSSTDFTNRGIYGFATHPDRITKTDLTSVSSITHGTTEPAVKDDVLEMIALAYAQKFYGPFVLYYSTQYDTIMEEDYFVMTTSGAAAPTKTVRQRLMEIQGIQDVRRLDLLTSAQTLLLVQMTGDTVRAVNGMDITTLQWESKGGMQLNFKVLCIQVPDIRSQFVGTSQTSRKAGIVHGTTA